MDSTLWLGSAGAFTPLHYDTYGTNIVAQVYGRKRWLMFSPDQTENLYPTRVPYEESSIYSSLDPRQDIDELAKEFPLYHHAAPAAVVEVGPGDILFIPKHWWHMVECVTDSLSVNCWLEEPRTDPIDLLREAVVRTLITALKNNEGDHFTEWLNPNEELLSHEDNLDLLRRSLVNLPRRGGKTSRERRDAQSDTLTSTAFINTLLEPSIIESIVDKLIYKFTPAKE